MSGDQLRKLFIQETGIVVNDVGETKLNYSPALTPAMFDRMAARIVSGESTKSLDPHPEVTVRSR